MCVDHGAATGRFLWPGCWPTGTRLQSRALPVQTTSGLCWEGQDEPLCWRGPAGRTQPSALMPCLLTADSWGPVACAGPVFGE